LYKERVSGSFTRSFTLPVPVDRNKVKATCKDGILEIVLPKAEEAKAKEIKIDVE
ncbi:MAG: Hsp20/alpha crystallin family protein, partial [Candidatus Ratteibacteria bacterium]